MSRVHRLEGDGHEAKPVHRRADHRDPREQEAGAKTADVCRKYGVSSATFYKWKAKYGGLDVSDAKRPKALSRKVRKATMDTASTLQKCTTS